MFLSGTFSSLLCVSALALLALPTAAIAAGDTASLDYRVELRVPPAQRKRLEDHLDLYRWRTSERMDEAQLQRLVRLAPGQIREFLAIDGYYSPTITAAAQKAGSAWLVKLSVEPGEPVRVGGFALRVSGAFADGSAKNRTRLEEMRSAWSLRAGAVFRQEDWESAKRDALKALLLNGYPRAAIADSRATVDPEARRAELQLDVDSGPAFTFGALEIQGLRRYPASIVLGLSPVVPGEPYSQTQLLELQSRLQDSPYFAAAAVSIETESADPLGVPVQVTVTEYPSRKLGFGIGASTDTGARGQIDYHDIDFLDRAWRLGGALKLDRASQSLSGDLQFPVGGQGYRDSLNAQIERTDIAGTVTRKLAMGPKRSFVSGKTETSYGLSYLTESQDVGGIPSTRAAALSPFYSWTLRQVDRLLDPSLGYLVNLQANVAARAVLSDQNFVRGYGRAVYFHPLGERGGLILRGELGAVAAVSRNGIPADFLFRTGGDQTVRGYAYQSLGLTQAGAIVGGRYLAVASGEYVHWLSPRWGSAVFVDAGNAADSPAALKPVYGYGAGARWKSPVGPLALDVAYGQATRKLRLHFSLGFAF